MISIACLVISGCGVGNAQFSFDDQISLSGLGAYTAPAGTYYVFGNSSGAVASSGNAIQVSFVDSFLPLYTYSYNGVYSDQLVSGSCNSLGTLIATIPTNPGNVVNTSFSATGCTDQTVINVFLDTTQIFDQAGSDGTILVTIPLTIDLAPKVSSAATGNTAASGSGTTEATAGYFKLVAGDSSIVVTFSKSLTGGTLNGIISGCAATLGTPVLVTGSSGTTVAWPLGNLGGVSVGQSCTINVSGVKDAIGNADDPSDSNLNMNFTFH